jgi:hypothetical protein
MKLLKLNNIQLKPQVLKLRLQNKITGEVSGTCTIELPPGAPLLAVDKFSWLLQAGYKVEDPEAK